MSPLYGILVFLILSFCLCNTDARKYNSVISVSNGGFWGEWEKPQFCSKGYAKGFSIKVEGNQGKGDDTGLNGIRLHCTNGEVIQSKSGLQGKWSKIKYCPKGNLVSFSLRVEGNQGKGDDTAANNVQFMCRDGSVIAKHQTNRGRFGHWSRRCHSASICGIQTRVEAPQKQVDDTALNDVKFFCCR
uniref:Vitelline membrane outer layer 1 homolog n=1 Tax=Anolis carolinensis TaxID=28377 RepID=A0A803SVR3_ANOCA